MCHCVSVTQELLAVETVVRCDLLITYLAQPLTYRFSLMSCYGFLQFKITKQVGDIPRLREGCSLLASWAFNNAILSKKLDQCMKTCATKGVQARECTRASFFAIIVFEAYPTG